MSAKPKSDSPTLAEYHGQTSRLCAVLGISPAGGRDKVRREFEAVAAWLQQEQRIHEKKERMMKELFG